MGWRGGGGVGCGQGFPYLFRGKDTLYVRYNYLQYQYGYISTSTERYIL